MSGELGVQHAHHEAEDLRRQLHALRKQTEAAGRERDGFARQLQQLGDAAVHETRELEWQAQQAQYERQVCVAGALACVSCHLQSSSSEAMRA